MATSPILTALLAGMMLLASVTANPTTTRAPQKEETCRRLTGAYGNGNNHFLFFGLEAVILDKDLNETETMPSYDLVGAPYPEAAFFWPIDNHDYFFSDAYYFSSWTNYAPVDAEVFGGRNHGQFFKDGLDAAGSVDGLTVFIKGCAFMISLPTHPEGPMQLPKSLPCSPDAAMTVGEELFIFKYDKMWKVTWGFEVHEPVDTASVINLKGLPLCAE